MQPIHARRSARLCALTLLCVVGGIAPGPRAGASSSAVATAVSAPMIDERVSGSEKQLLESSVGFAMPEFTDDVAWLSREPVSFEGLRGKVVVLNTWDSNTTDGRNITRRVTTLLRKFGDDVQQVALHTPEEADEVLAKYGRYRGTLPVPMAIDTRGAYLDELGVYKTPRIIVIDREGRIAHAGVSFAQLRDAVQRTLNREDSGVTTPSALPPRSERVDEETPKGDVEDVDWPAHNRIQAGSATNLQGQKGPELVVQKYLNTDAPETAGKVVMMEFWATWCGPCIAGIPHLNDLQRSFADDLVVVGITSEDERTVRDKMRTDDRLDFGYPVAIDRQRRVQGAVGNRGIPHCIVVSSDGVVRWQGHPARLTERVIGQIVRANRTLGVGGAARWVQPG
ncbi:MAG: TlpA family protein disulfide reductase [Planctomycetota bacterium]